MLHIDTTVIDLLVGGVLPLIVGVVTKRLASPAVKASVLALLAAITGVLVQIGQAGGDFDLEKSVVSVALAWIAGGVLHQTFWKPIGATAAVQSVAPNTGVGKPGIRDEYGRFTKRAA